MSRQMNRQSGKSGRNSNASKAVSSEKLNAPVVLSGSGPQQSSELDPTARYIPHGEGASVHHIVCSMRRQRLFTIGSDLTLQQLPLFDPSRHRVKAVAREDQNSENDGAQSSDTESNISATQFSPNAANNKLTNSSKHSGFGRSSSMQQQNSTMSLNSTAVDADGQVIALKRHDFALGQNNTLGLGQSTATSRFRDPPRVYETTATANDFLTEVAIATVSDFDGFSLDDKPGVDRLYRSAADLIGGRSTQSDNGGAMNTSITSKFVGSTSSKTTTAHPRNQNASHQEMVTTGTTTTATISGGDHSSKRTRSKDKQEVLVVKGLGFGVKDDRSADGKKILRDGAHSSPSPNERSKSKKNKKKRKRKLEQQEQEIQLYNDLENGGADGILMEKVGGEEIPTLEFSRRKAKKEQAARAISPPILPAYRVAQNATRQAMEQQPLEQQDDGVSEEERERRRKKREQAALLRSRWEEQTRFFHLLEDHSRIMNVLSGGDERLKQSLKSFLMAVHRGDQAGALSGLANSGRILPPHLSAALAKTLSSIGGNKASQQPANTLGQVQHDAAVYQATTGKSSTEILSKQLVSRYLAANAARINAIPTSGPRSGLLASRKDFIHNHGGSLFPGTGGGIGGVPGSHGLHGRHGTSAAPSHLLAKHDASPRLNLLKEASAGGTLAAALKEYRNSSNLQAAKWYKKALPTVPVDDLLLLGMQLNEMEPLPRSKKPSFKGPTNCGAAVLGVDAAGNLLPSTGAGVSVSGSSLINDGAGRPGSVGFSGKGISDGKRKKSKKNKNSSTTMKGKMNKTVLDGDDEVERDEGREGTPVAADASEQENMLERAKAVEVVPRLDGESSSDTDSEEERPQSELLEMNPPRKMDRNTVDQHHQGTNTTGKKHVRADTNNNILKGHGDLHHQHHILKKKGILASSSRGGEASADQQHLASEMPRVRLSWDGRVLADEEAHWSRVAEPVPRGRTEDDEEIEAGESRRLKRISKGSKPTEEKQRMKGTSNSSSKKAETSFTNALFYPEPEEAELHQAEAINAATASKEPRKTLNQRRKQLLMNEHEEESKETRQDPPDEQNEGKPVSMMYSPPPAKKLVKKLSLIAKRDKLRGIVREKPKVKKPTIMTGFDQIFPDGGHHLLDGKKPPSFFGTYFDFAKVWAGGGARLPGSGTANANGGGAKASMRKNIKMKKGSSTTSSAAGSSMKLLRSNSKVDSTVGSGRAGSNGVGPHQGPHQGSGGSASSSNAGLQHQNEPSASSSSKTTCSKTNKIFSTNEANTGVVPTPQRLLLFNDDRTLLVGMEDGEVLILSLRDEARADLVGKFGGPSASFTGISFSVPASAGEPSATTNLLGADHDSNALADFVSPESDFLASLAQQQGGGSHPLGKRQVSSLDLFSSSTTRGAAAEAVEDAGAGTGGGEKGRKPNKLRVTDLVPLSVSSTSETTPLSTLFGITPAGGDHINHKCHDSAAAGSVGGLSRSMSTDLTSTDSVSGLQEADAGCNDEALNRSIRLQLSSQMSQLFSPVLEKNAKNKERTTQDAAVDNREEDNLVATRAKEMLHGLLGDERHVDVNTLHEVVTARRTTAHIAASRADGDISVWRLDIEETLDISRYRVRVVVKNAEMVSVDRSVTGGAFCLLCEGKKKQEPRTKETNKRNEGNMAFSNDGDPFEEVGGTINKKKDYETTSSSTSGEQSLFIGGTHGLARGGDLLNYCAKETGPTKAVAQVFLAGRRHVFFGGEDGILRCFVDDHGDGAATGLEEQQNIRGAGEDVLPPPRSNAASGGVKGTSCTGMKTRTTKGLQLNHPRRHLNSGGELSAATLNAAAMNMHATYAPKQPVR
ncbi:unnamed protein product [Amoebophrya sp. A25]|nr:unnamed protein product [Amoebophrya sp. A25]|eukprot:GSA25T00017258001.1